MLYDYKIVNPMIKYNKLQVIDKRHNVDETTTITTSSTLYIQLHITSIYKKVFTFDKSNSSSDQLIIYRTKVYYPYLLPKGSYNKEEGLFQESMTRTFDLS